MPQRNTQKISCDKYNILDNLHYCMNILVKFFLPRPYIVTSFSSFQFSNNSIYLYIKAVHIIHMIDLSKDIHVIHPPPTYIFECKKKISIWFRQSKYNWVRYNIITNQKKLQEGKHRRNQGSSTGHGNCVAIFTLIISLLYYISMHFYFLCIVCL